MHPGQRKSFPEGSRVIRQAGAASHVEGSPRGVQLMIKAGMWQAGTGLDLSAELLVKLHRVFGGTLLCEPRPPLDSPGCFSLVAHSLGALIHLEERGLRSLHTSGAKQTHGRGALCCNTACAVCSYEGWGTSLSKEKATNSS